MKCPTCVAQGERSFVYPGSTSTTALGFQQFYDEEGVWHVHDPNRSTTSYSCSRSHTWDQVSGYPCPAGDFEIDTAPTQENDR